MSWFYAQLDFITKIFRNTFMETGIYDRELFTLLDSFSFIIIFVSYFFVLISFTKQFYDDGLISRVFHCTKKRRRLIDKLKVWYTLVLMYHWCETITRLLTLNSINNFNIIFINFVIVFWLSDINAPCTCKMINSFIMGQIMCCLMLYLFMVVWRRHPTVAEQQTEMNICRQVLDY